MACNCNRNGDVEYTITLNQQGPQGRQGNVGQNGFSPEIVVYSSTEANYQLKIITSDGELITPNLKGQTPSLEGTVTINGNQNITGTKNFVNNTRFGNGITVIGNATVDGNKIITEPEFDELADDVVDINSQLAGLSFKKYTEEEYASITNPDANTIYYVTSPDGNTFKVYLGDLELPQSEGGSGGGISINNISGYTVAKATNISGTVTEGIGVDITGKIVLNTTTGTFEELVDGTFYDGSIVENNLISDCRNTPRGGMPTGLAANTYYYLSFEYYYSTQYGRWLYFKTSTTRYNGYQVGIAKTDGSGNLDYTKALLLFPNNLYFTT